MSSSLFSSSFFIKNLSINFASLFISSFFFILGLPTLRICLSLYFPSLINFVIFSIADSNIAHCSFDLFQIFCFIFFIILLNSSGYIYSSFLFLFIFIICFVIFSVLSFISSYASFTIISIFKSCTS